MIDKQCIAFKIKLKNILYNISKYSNNMQLDNFPNLCILYMM